MKEVMFSESKDHKDFRLEPEFYTARTLLKGASCLGKDAIDFIQYGTSDELNEEEGGYPTLRLNEINGGFIEEPKKFCASLSKKEFDELRIRKGDVLVCRTNGNPRLVGKSAVAIADTNFAFASYLFKVRPDASIISPETLTIFLNCKAGRAEIEKHSIRSNQVNFSPDKMKQIRLPRFERPIIEKIDASVRAAYEAVEYSKSLSTQAELLLLRALKMDNWQPPATKYYEVNSNLVHDAARMDPDFFHPKYTALLDSLEECIYEVADLASIIEPIRSGFDFREFQDEGTPYLRVGDISSGRIDYDSAAKISLSPSDIKKDISLQIGDVLFTRKGSFGNAAVVCPGEEKSIISSEIMLLRLIDPDMVPDYLALYLNSRLGFLQVERYAHGAAFYSISQADLARVQIVLPPKEVQEKIAGKVQQARAAQEHSKTLLKRAKRAVEVAIEQDEGAGLKVLEAG